MNTLPIQEQYAHAVQTASTPSFDGFLVSDLEQVFNRICDPNDWKAPICCAVKGEQVAIAVAAIEFYTATIPTVAMSQTPSCGIAYVLTSPGYRNGPAGDH